MVKHLAIVAVLVLSGCTSVSEKSDIIPKSDVTMKEIYENKGRPDKEASQQLTAKTVMRRPATDYELSVNAYDTNSVNEKPQFRKLPNPTLYIYFPPKLTKKERLPIPAWMTEFKMYDKDEYAERGELNLGGRQ